MIRVVHSDKGERVIGLTVLLHGAGTTFVNSVSNILATLTQSATLRIALPPQYFDSAEQNWDGNAMAEERWGRTLSLGPLQYGALSHGRHNLPNLPRPQVAAPQLDSSREGASGLNGFYLSLARLHPAGRASAEAAARRRLRRGPPNPRGVPRLPADRDRRSCGQGGDQAGPPGGC